MRTPYRTFKRGNGPYKVAAHFDCASDEDVNVVILEEGEVVCKPVKCLTCDGKGLSSYKVLIGGVAIACESFTCLACKGRKVVYEPVHASPRK